MIALVQFAGDDQPARVYRHSRPKLSAVSSMFRFGSDTMQISAALDISEARVLKRVTLERCKRLGLPNPYHEDR